MFTFKLADKIRNCSIQNIFMFDPPTSPKDFMFICTNKKLVNNIYVIYDYELKLGKLMIALTVNDNNLHTNVGINLMHSCFFLNV